MNGIEYLRGLRILRSDPDWLSKIGVGSLLLLSSMIIPIVGQVALQGWVALTLRRAAAGHAEPLPRLDLDFDYLGKLLGSGFKAFIVSFLWTLPAGFLVGGGVACIYIGFVMSIIGGAQAGDAGAGLGFGMICLLGAGIPVLMLLGVLLSLPAQMAVIRAEVSDDLNQGLQFGEVLDMTKRVFRELLIGSLVLAAVQAAFVVVSLPLCYLPLLPSMIAIMIARAHLGAQLYQLYLERGGQPIPVGSLDMGVVQPGGAAAAAPTTF